MSINQMRAEIRKVYKGWKALDTFDDGKVTAIYFKLKREGRIK